ncbi:MAG: metal-dependent hydrolase [Desulfobacteraceae bacterium]|jgi:membrane-bound metal-dependent hydrolase YbcI (DUF457 family)
MPLPLGHAAIGLAVQDVCFRDNSVSNRWTWVLFIAILANLPDMDVLLGLLFQGNGNAYHRGPTHSLIFTLLMGLLASNAWRLWTRIPRMNFLACAVIILSHVAADFFLTSSAVSFFWPLEVHWTAGYKGWRDVISLVFLGGFRDVGIIITCGAIMILKRAVIQMRYQVFRDSRSGQV